jgi:hypothetical protein
MSLKNKIKKVLREHYGEFDTELEHQYEVKLTNNLIVGSLNDKRAWATYNQIVLEMKHSIKDMLKVKELQYKLTDDSDPNEVIIEVIEPLKELTPELERLYYKVRNFN